MKIWTTTCLSLAALIVAPTMAHAKDQKLTGLALQQIQAKDFETSVDVLFPAVVSVLQDAGYRINQADRASGFVSGQGSAEQKLTFNLWWGMGKKKSMPVVSAFMEQRGPGIARLRLNFVMSTGKSRDNMSDESPITDPAVYKDAFEKVEKEVFVRQAMSTPASASPAAVIPAAASAAAPAAAAPAGAH